MDSLLEDFSRDVLEYRKFAFPMTRIEALARHLREVVQPQLAELQAKRPQLARLEQLQRDLEFVQRSGVARAPRKGEPCREKVR